MTEEEDKVAILAVMEAETEAYIRKDLDALSEHWVHSPQSRRMVSVAFLGTQVFEGWDAIKENYKHLIEQFPDKHAMARLHTERMNIVINGDTAWVSYDQVGDKSDDYFEMSGTLHELKIFHRIAGKWKMSCIVVMQRAIEQATCSLIEISPDRRVLWMNSFAHEQLPEYKGLIVSGGRLRTQSRSQEKELQDAVDWASSQRKTTWPSAELNRIARAVNLGENDDTAPIFCWVMVEDGKLLVSFNDTKMVKRRVEIAQEIYGLTTAQVLLAQLLAQGHDLSKAAEKLGVSINTVRTHLQRMFDRTGARSQSALVGILLSAEAPTTR